MARLAQLPELAIINGFKGSIDFYVWKGLPCARRWPRPPRGPRSLAVQAQWEPFAYASRLWTLQSKEVQDAYRSMASGSTMSGRDMSIKLYINATFIYPGLP